MDLEREEAQTSFFIVTLHSTMKNSDLLEKDGTLRANARRNIDYRIVQSSAWDSCREKYDVEIPIRDVYNVFISFSCNGIAYKNVYVHGVDKIFDVIQALFVNKAFSIESFNHMFVLKWRSEVVDPAHNFEYFGDSSKKVTLVVERRQKRAEDDDKILETSFINENEVSSMCEKTRAIHRQDGLETNKFSYLLEKSLKFYKSLYTVDSKQRILLQKAASVIALEAISNELHTETQEEATLIERMGNQKCAGIVNIGNSCYMNASIQCLNNCSVFSNFFAYFANLFNNNNENQPFFEPINQNAFQKNANVIRQWTKVVMECRGEEVICPKTLKQSIADRNKSFGNSKQQDAAEFIESLLACLHEGLSYKKECIKNIPSSQECTEASSSSAGDESGAGKDASQAQAFERLISNEKSIISSLFYGMYTTTMECNSCGYSKQKSDLIMLLPLSIPKKTCYHCSTTLIQFGMKAPVKILIPVNLTVHEAIEYTKIEHCVTRSLVAVEYCNGEIIKVLPPQKCIGTIKNSIVLFEVAFAKRHCLCRFFYTKFIVFNTKMPLDFLIEEDCLRANIYEKLGLYFVKNLTIREFFEKVKIRKGPFNEILGVPTIEVFLGNHKELFGSHCQLFSLSPAKKMDDVSLKDCLSHCFKEETVGLRCERCMKECKFTMKSKLTHSPQYLIIQLKRFNYHGNETKINTFIDFPEGSLKIDDHSYRLVATANHIEIGLGYGHYIAFLRKETGWYCCNDNLISKVPGPDKSTSYILFYEKIE